MFEGNYRTILQVGMYKRWLKRVQSQIKQTAFNSITHSTPPIKPLTRHTLTHTIDIVNYVIDLLVLKNDDRRKLQNNPPSWYV